MKQRFLTSLFLLAILVPMFLFGGYVMIAGATVFCVFGVYELVNMYTKKYKLSKCLRFIIPCYGGIFSIILGLFLKNKFELQIGDFIFYFIVMIFSLMIVPIFNRNIKMRDIIFFIFAVLYGGVFLSLAFNIRNIDLSHIAGFNEFSGMVIATSVIGTSVLTDIFAQLSGMLFGKHKLCPNISPKKTIEGAVGGTVVASILVIGLMFLLNYIFKDSIDFLINQPYKIILLILSIITISILGQIGDLVASKIKREFEIKDFSSIFPGHGGVLDRFDSFIFVGLSTFIALSLIGIIL